MDDAVAAAVAWAGGALGVETPLQAAPIAAGRSNLTYRLSARDGRSWILRRPPSGQLLAGAHDMGREFTILQTLHAQGSVPVPRPIIDCADPSVLGVPFYVMEDVAGAVLRTPGDAVSMPGAVREAASGAIVNVLGAIHAVPLEGGLEMLGRRSGYVQRQLHRWLEHVMATHLSAPEFPMQAQALRRLAPDDAPHTLVHGDYRLDNLILDPRTGAVRAVVDWEIGTIGDPLADLASFLISWDEPGDQRAALGAPGASAAGGFSDRASMMRRYLEHGDAERAAAWMQYYLAFAYWKLGCILHCVAARYGAGGGGGAQTPPAGSDHIVWLLERSSECLSSYRRGRSAPSVR